MHKALDPRDKIDRLQERKRKMTSYDTIDETIHSFEGYTQKRKKRRLTAASNNIGSIKQTVKQQRLKSKNGKKNNFMDTSSDKLGRRHTRLSGHGKKGKCQERNRNYCNSSTK